MKKKKKERMFFHAVNIEVTNREVICPFYDLEEKFCNASFTHFFPDSLTMRVFCSNHEHPECPVYFMRELRCRAAI